MRGKRTPPKKAEKVKQLSAFFCPREISNKTGLALRTIYDILAKKDSLIVEQKREEKRLKIVDKVFSETEAEVQEEVNILKEKGKMLLDHLTPEKAEKARLTEITIAYGTLFDKRRLLENKSTSNISFASLIRNASVPIKKLEDQGSENNED